MMSFIKGKKIIYRSGAGVFFTAVVLTVHRNGEATIKVYFPLEKGKEADFGFVGAKYRIGPANVYKYDFKVAS